MARSLGSIYTAGPCSWTNSAPPWGENSWVQAGLGTILYLDTFTITLFDFSKDMFDKIRNMYLHVFNPKLNKSNHKKMKYFLKISLCII